jgi:hypothetical protein
MDGVGLIYSKQLTASGEVGTAGRPIRIFSVVALSGASAGSSTFKTGGSGGTTWLTLTCPTVSASNVWYFEEGIRFPSGCYWTKDSNTTNVVVTYYEEMN